MVGLTESCRTNTTLIDKPSPHQLHLSRSGWDPTWQSDPKVVLRSSGTAIQLRHSSNICPAWDKGSPMTPIPSRCRVGPLSYGESLNHESASVPNSTEPASQFSHCWSQIVTQLSSRIHRVHSFGSLTYLHLRLSCSGALRAHRVVASHEVSGHPYQIG